jgi:hypothetical protein
MLSVPRGIRRGPFCRAGGPGPVTAARRRRARDSNRERVSRRAAAGIQQHHDSTGNDEDRRAQRQASALYDGCTRSPRSWPAGTSAATQRCLTSRCHRYESNAAATFRAADAPTWRIRRERGCGAQARNHAARRSFPALWQAGGDRLDLWTAPGDGDRTRIRDAHDCGVGGVGAPRGAGREHHEVRVADPDRHVADKGDPGCAGWLLVAGLGWLPYAVYAPNQLTTLM